MVQMLLLFFAIVLKMGYLFAFIFQSLKGFHPLKTLRHPDTFNVSLLFNIIYPMGIPYCT